MEYNVPFIVADFETGGLSAEKNPAVEIAVVVLDNNCKEIQRYESLIKPYGDFIIEQQALQANGLTLNEINGGKDVKAVVNDLITLFTPLKKYQKFVKPILVGHNIAKFDIKFFKQIFEFCNKNLYEYVDEYLFDTQYHARFKWGQNNQIENFKLGTCCTKVGIELTNAHRAMADTEATAKLLTYFINDSRSIKTNSEVKIERFREKFKF